MQEDQLDLLKAAQKVNVESFDQNGWSFEFEKSILTNSLELDKLGEEWNLQQMPEILFNNNRVKIKHDKVQIVMNCEEALKLCNMEYLKERHGSQDVNRVHLIPNEIHLKQHKEWKQKVEEKMQDNPDIKILNRSSDPFYSTPFMGTLQGSIVIEETQEQIPVNRLGQNNPIVWGNMVQLYEDELGDNGSVSTEIRFRTMKDCWFALIRHYLRVDDVVIRIYDTRLFHDYSTDYILREFTAKEDTYQNIKNKGFEFTPKWATDQNQSFMVTEYLKLDLKKVEKIVLV